MKIFDLLRKKTGERFSPVSLIEADYLARGNCGLQLKTLPDHPNKLFL